MIISFRCQLFVFWFVGACIVVAFSSSVPATAAGFPTSGQFDQVTTITSARMSLRMVQSVTFKGADIRVDSDEPTEMIPMTTIQTPDAQYLYSPLATSGQKLPIKDKQLPLLEQMDADTKTKLEGTTLTGANTFEGYACDIYKTTVKDGQETIELWVSKDPKFPFTLRTIATDKLLQKTTTVELQNIVLNNEIDDSQFDIPVNIKFTVPAQVQTPSAPSAPSTHTGGTVSK